LRSLLVAFLLTVTMLAASPAISSPDGYQIESTPLYVLPIAHEGKSQVNSPTTHEWPSAAAVDAVLTFAHPLVIPGSLITADLAARAILPEPERWRSPDDSG